MKEDKGPSFTRTFGNMGFFQPPSLPFQEKPHLVTEEYLGAFREHQEGASLLALRGLQELDLSACSKLTDTSITQVVTSVIKAFTFKKGTGYDVKMFLAAPGTPVPRPAASLAFYAAWDQRRQLGVRSLSLPQPLEPGAQPLSPDQWPGHGTGPSAPLQTAASVPGLLRRGY